MTIAEAAEATGLGEHRLHHAIEAGEIRAEESVSGHRTYTMIDPASVEAFVAASADLIGITDVLFLLNVKPEVIKALGGSRSDHHSPEIQRRWRFDLAIQAQERRTSPRINPGESLPHAKSGDRQQSQLPWGLRPVRPVRDQIAHADCCHGERHYQAHWNR